jgi:hypothetical protein
MHADVCMISFSCAQVNQDRIEEGMHLLEEALDCKWVAVEAAKVLQQVCVEPCLWLHHTCPLVCRRS